MAERRMFAKQIIDSDAFLEMPLSTQALYFHMAMRADDDGFVHNPKRIQRMVNASDDDLRILALRKFIIPFESGVVVIKHWKIHNYIQKDRYKETAYLDEKSQLIVKENNAYSLDVSDLDTRCIQDASSLETQVSIGKSKDRLGKDRLGKENNEKNGRFSPPSIQEVAEYCASRGNGIDPQRFVDYYQQQGWKLSNGNPMKDWRAAVRTWENRNPKKINHELDGVF